MGGDVGELRLLCLDLATVTGWAAGPMGQLPRFGSFRVSGSDLGRFLCDFYDRLDGLIVEHRPTLIVFEAPIIMVGGSALATVRKLTGLTGVTEMLAWERAIPVREAGASEIAKALLGRARFPGGRKEKKAETVRACKALGFAVRDDNEADAVALWLYAAGLLDAGRRPRFAGPLLGSGNRMSDDIPEDAKSLVSDVPKRHPATAHFPIEGAAQSCRSCAHFLKAQRKKGRCIKWAEFMSRAYRLEPAYRAEHADWWSGLPTISRETPACKYFAAP